MFTTCLLIVKYLFDAFRMVFFYTKVLGRKYSVQATIAATLALWLTQCLTKILVYTTSGLMLVKTLSVINWMGTLVFTLTCFGSTAGKRLLALFIEQAVMGLTEVMAYFPAMWLTGSFAMMQMEESFTAVCIFIHVPLETAGTVLMICLWKKMQQIKWKFGWQIWLCVILPLSQVVFLAHICLSYTAYDIAVPLVAVCGLALGVAADFYMFTLFFRAGQREKAEEELQVLQHQYELERLRYEQLFEQQKETAKLRHDFQNYILTMRNME